MIVLALDSRSVQGSAALWQDGRVAEERPCRPDRSFSSQLPGLLLGLVADHGLVVTDVDVFAACTGPGSLTGLRVGLSTVQGLAFATGRAVVGVSALEAAAAGAAQCVLAAAADVGWVGAWLDAFRGEVFTACYRLEAAGRTWRDRLIEVEGPSVATPDETAARWATVMPGSRGVIAGDPVGQVALAAAVGERAQWREAGLLAGTVAVLAAERATSESTPPHALHPLYVRRPDAEVARDRRLAASKDTGR